MTRRKGLYGARSPLLTDYALRHRFHNTTTIATTIVLYLGDLGFLKSEKHFLGPK